jgi:hypothetical protein
MNDPKRQIDSAHCQRFATLLLAGATLGIILPVSNAEAKSTNLRTSPLAVLARSLARSTVVITFRPAHCVVFPQPQPKVSLDDHK